MDKVSAYLNTIPGVRNPVRSNQLPFPFNIRLGLAVWDQLFFTPGTFHPDPSKSGEWNRGAYLVEGLEHCGACHTPRGLAFQEKAFDAGGVGDKREAQHEASRQCERRAQHQFSTSSDHISAS